MDLSKLGSGGGLKNKIQVTASGNWTVPPDVYELEIWATAGGGGGGGAPAAFPSGGGGGGGGVTGICRLAVTPGAVLQITIGAGGAGGIGANNGASGGNTVVSLANCPIIAAQGSGGGGQAQSGNSSTAGPAGVSSSLDFGRLFRFNSGGPGAPTGPGSNGNYPQASHVGSSGEPSSVISAQAANGGTGLPSQGGGGGGGCSIYGVGGNGGAAINGAATSAQNGGNASVTAYGAGGGGAGGATSLARNGGNGAPGIVEIYY